MSAIISWLANIAKAIGHWFTDLFHDIVLVTTKAWGLGIIIAGLAYAAFHDTIGAVQTLFGLVGSIAYARPSISAPSGVNVSYLLSITNTFTPLDEFFQYAGAYLVVLGAFGIYRLIKSWIPGFTGGG